MAKKHSGMFWTATSIVITYAVWCTVLVFLTASRHLVNSQSFECGTSRELEATVLRRVSMVYSWSGFSLPICILLLVGIWMKNTPCVLLSVFGMCVLFVYMTINFGDVWQKEEEGLVAFEERYKSLRHLHTYTYMHSNTPRGTQMHLNVGYYMYCDGTANVDRWQTEFKCCGLQSYRDWWRIIPDSCLCEGVDDSSECVQYRNNTVYYKPCLPIVLSLTAKGSYTFWAIMITWLCIVGTPVSLLILCVLGGIVSTAVMYCCEAYWSCANRLSEWKRIRSGGEKLVHVVFLRKDNCDQTDEDSSKDREVEESKSDEAVAIETEDESKVAQEERDLEEEIDDNSMGRIPVSLLKKLQEELDPPPVEREVKCLCLMGRNTRKFYTVMIESDSPLLPTDAVLADVNKRPRNCLWAEGPHLFCVENIIWPREYQP